MAEVIPQRMSATLDGDEFVVFLIGARINRPFRVGSWLPVARAMSRMIKELVAQPELGMLGYEHGFGRTIIMLQYWRSLPLLLEYAKARDAAHLPAWQEFNRRIAQTADVGIWHETYVVRPGCYENFYNNMPAFGLGRVGKLTPVGKYGGASTEGAADRFAGSKLGTENVSGT
jgi:Domain of unknown function (DUF4188)